ncbi:MAG: FAD-dependent oxidoreductase [Holosporaceae bacterium]|jgi:2-oxoacid:acceptor oxidoreductase delta subunit (pyruvate/2-ketoisovalerate family)|nr:FAD-dependent oxidoreductase [Holosporaceae bacterium]
MSKFIIMDIATSLKNKTGSWRTVRPEFVRRLPPCNVACPAGENIQQWLSLIQEGKFLEAWREMLKNNPFPAIMGRVCYHNCEKACNRGQFDCAVNINLLERSIGDMAIANGWKLEENASDCHPSGKKVLVIGAGPSGLTAAYFLRQYGHSVTIYEAQIKPGGMMRYGVPSYRLDRTILDAEINRIIVGDMKLSCNKRVNCLETELQRFDAIYVATGANLAVKTGMEIKDNAVVMDAIDMFRQLENGNLSIRLQGGNVLVYGGGNTAVDSARTALRLGAKNVKIIYRRTLPQMKAHDSEIQEALKEGIEIVCLRTINAIDGKKVLLEEVLPGENSGVIHKSGNNEVVRADAVIFAVGQSIDNNLFSKVDGLEISENGALIVNKNMATSIAGIFAGGDIIHGKRTVTDAIGHGKKAARHIDAYLRGIEFASVPKSEVANFKKINTDYFQKIDGLITSEFAKISFEENKIFFNEEELIRGACRCFSCGNCANCDNCYGYCPDCAIRKKKDNSLEINYDYCKGCGICATECPHGAIKMTSEDA